MHIRSFANEIIDIGNVDLELQIERTNRKRTIALHVKNNKLIIKTPRSVSKKTLVDFIKRKQRWINQRAILNFEEQNLKNREFIDNDKFYFRGDEYRLSLILGRKEAVKIEGGLLVVSYVDDKSIGKENIKRLLEDWYLKESIKILEARTEELAQQMRVQPYGITVKNYKSKWGSCTANNKISYNGRIIMAPDHIIDYLIVHELSHIIEPNHSKNFWYHVGHYCKDFQKKRKWLRENGHKLVL
ncbi:M48 family metallopeptidase [Paracoccaceae bacterium]|nr:M48 family metallopeptidase [Paracoccaceae bacterium]